MLGRVVGTGMLPPFSEITSLYVLGSPPLKSPSPLGEGIGVRLWVGWG